MLRVAHLDGLDIAAGGGFYFDARVFELREPALEPFRAAFARLAASGIGPRRGRAELERAGQLDLAETATGRPCVIDLDPGPAPVAVVERPEFPILFGRPRDRIGTLRAARCVGVGRQTVWGKGDMRVC